MSDKIKKPIRQKLAVAAALLMGAIGVFISLFFPLRQAAQMKQSLKDKGLVVANMLASSAEAGLKFADASAIEEALKSLARVEEVQTALVFDGKGKRFAVYQEEKRGLIPESETTAKAGEAAGAHWSEINDLLILRTAVVSGKDTLGTIVLGISQSRLNADVSYSRMMAVGVGAILTFLGTLAFWLLATRIVKPIRQLQQVAQRVTEGDLNVAVNIRSGDEIQMLGESFQGLMEYLQAIALGAEALSNGDLTKEVKARSQKDVLSRNFGLAGSTLRKLISEVEGLIASAREGQLERRGDAQQFQGVYCGIVQGINDMLDAVVHPINEAAKVLDTVAAKNLKARIEGEYRGDYARIKTSLNLAVQNLGEALSQVATGAEQVTSAAGQISSGSQSLSSKANDQASSLQEVSGSLQEMASMTKQNAVNAKEARAMTEGAQSASERGVESMKRLSQSIDKIKSSSDATAKIVKTIDEIAFQTNLLALNAAVEAARAGDAGKGFAVVAEEVRNLAMRSAEAAKNTANLIEESVKNAESGVSLNQEVLKNLDEINAQIRKVSEVMAQIAVASNQQSQGVEQINHAVDQMNQVVQEVAANAEESASTATMLSTQSSQMLNMVQSFTIDAARGNGADKYPAWDITDAAKAHMPLPARSRRVTPAGKDFFLTAP